MPTKRVEFEDLVFELDDEGWLIVNAHDDTTMVFSPDEVNVLRKLIN